MGQRKFTRRRLLPKKQKEMSMTIFQALAAIVNLLPKIYE
jgi:hypothetical protein